MFNFFSPQKSISCPLGPSLLLLTLIQLCASPELPLTVELVSCPASTGPSVVAIAVGPHFCHLWINQRISEVQSGSGLTKTVLFSHLFSITAARFQDCGAFKFKNKSKINSIFAKDAQNYDICYAINVFRDAVMCLPISNVNPAEL